MQANWAFKEFEYFDSSTIYREMLQALKWRMAELGVDIVYSSIDYSAVFNTLQPEKKQLISFYQNYGDHIP